MITIYPTDTVWGIGGAIYKESDYKEIAILKGHNLDKPLSVLFNSIDTLTEYFELKWDKRILQNFFSLETTMLIPTSLLKAGVLNLPKNPSCWGVRVLPLFDDPITTTSCNLNGKPPIITFEEANKFYKHYKLDFDLKLINFEIKPSGHPSTIVDILNFKIIRNGFYVKEVQKMLLENFKN